MKHEIKVEFSDSKVLKEIIEKVYFEEGIMGKIVGNKHFLKIEESDEVLHTIFKGLNNATVKIFNDEVIDGNMRFLIDETQNELRLYPISIYCLKEDRYIFY